MRISDRIVAWLGARYAPWLVIAIGIALAAPAVTSPFAADDHLHRIIARSDPGIAGLHARPLDLFVFANGDPADNVQLRDAGLFPWWADVNLRLSFMRPISSATHAIDHALWPDSAPAALGHSLLWHALALVVVWLFFRRFVPPNARWIANRNALVALTLAMPVLLAHDRWRRDGWTLGRWLAPLLFAVSLGAGESALAITAYLGAHALWLDPAPWRSRLAALLPYVLIVLAWRVLYAHLGYGVAGSGIYLDPGADPRHFLGAAATRIPFLLLGQFAVPWSDLASLYPVIGALVPMLAIALATLVAIALAFARLVRRDPVARFFATAMLLAAIPVASTFPADRLLVFIGIGGMGLVAQLLAAALRNRDLMGDGRPRRLAIGVVAIAMVLCHLVLAPPLLVLRSRSMVAVGRVLDRADAGIPRDAGVTDKTVIVATTPSDALCGYIPIMRQSRHEPRPAHLYWLATSTTAVTIERLDARTLRVTPDTGFLRYEIDQMVRSPVARPFAVGDRVPLTNLEIEVESVTPDGRPRTVLAHFAAPLDDPRYVWRRWQGHSYVPYAPPAIGARETFPPVDFGKLLEE